MDTSYILALLLSTLFFIGIPILIIWLIYLVLKNKINKRLAIIVGLILIGIFTYTLISGFYPGESFYANNLKENTDLSLPKPAILIANSGNNSIYNFGDYNISFAYQFTEPNYEKLYKQLLDKAFKQSDTYLETAENEKILSTTPDLKIEKILSKNYGFKNFEALFLSDKKTIVFNSNKW